MPRQLLLVSLAGAAAFAVTGCGGSGAAKQGAATTSSTTVVSSIATAPTPKPGPALHLGKVAYEKAMRRLGKQLGDTVLGLYPLSSGARGSQAAKSTIAHLRRAYGVTSGVLAQLERIVPPRPIAAQHKQVEQGVRQLDKELSTMIVSLRTGDLATFVGQSNFESLQTINDAADAMKKKGYDIIGQRAAPAGK